MLQKRCVSSVTYPVALRSIFHENFTQTPAMYGQFPNLNRSKVRPSRGLPRSSIPSVFHGPISEWYAPQSSIWINPDQHFVYVQNNRFILSKSWSQRRQHFLKESLVGLVEKKQVSSSDHLIMGPPQPYMQKARLDSYLCRVHNEGDFAQLLYYLYKRQFLVIPWVQVELLNKARSISMGSDGNESTEGMAYLMDLKYRLETAYNVELSTSFLLEMFKLSLRSKQWSYVMTLLQYDRLFPMNAPSREVLHWICVFITKLSPVKSGDPLDVQLWSLLKMKSFPITREVMHALMGMFARHHNLNQLEELYRHYCLSCIMKKPSKLRFGSDLAGYDPTISAGFIQVLSGMNTPDKSLLGIVLYDMSCNMPKKWLNDPKRQKLHLEAIGKIWKHLSLSHSPQNVFTLITPCLQTFFKALSESALSFPENTQSNELLRELFSVLNPHSPTTTTLNPLSAEKYSSAIRHHLERVVDKKDVEDALLLLDENFLNPDKLALFD